MQTQTPATVRMPSKIKIKRFVSYVCLSSMSPSVVSHHSACLCEWNWEAAKYRSVETLCSTYCWLARLVCMPQTGTYIMMVCMYGYAYRSKRPCAMCIPLFHYSISVAVFSFSLCVCRVFAPFIPWMYLIATTILIIIIQHNFTFSSAYLTNSQVFVVVDLFFRCHSQIASMGFKSNGKPGRIYHWNLPVLKKMLTKKNEKSRKSTNLRLSNDINDLIDIKSIPTWSNPWDENDTLEKAFGKHQVTQPDDDLMKLFKKKTPTYYAPAKQKKSDTTKYFPGNGKPKSFYVIKKNQHKPFYQKLIPWFYRTQVLWIKLHIIIMIIILDVCNNKLLYIRIGNA